MTEQKHTPLPWAVANTALKPMGDYFGYAEVILPKENEEEVNPQVEVMSARLSEDAAFIVKACNSHYELLEACKELLVHLQRLTPYENDMERHADATARAAIAKAESN